MGDQTNTAMKSISEDVWIQITANMNFNAWTLDTEFLLYIDPDKILDITPTFTSFSTGFADTLIIGYDSLLMGGTTKGLRLKNY